MFFLFPLFIGGCGTDEDSIVGKYTTENTLEMEVEFTEDGKCLTKFSGTYVLESEEENQVLLITQADTFGADEYQIVQQGDLMELQQNGQTVLSLKHQSGKNGLAEDSAQSFEGSYCYASDRVELQGSGDSVSYLLERTENGLCFRTADGRTVLELVKK